VDPTSMLLVQMNPMGCSPPEFLMLPMAYWSIAMDRLYLDWQVKEPMKPVPMKLVLVMPASFFVG
jgi:hypothetical protein